MGSAVETKVLRDIQVGERVVTAVDESKFSLSDMIPDDGLAISSDLSVVGHNVYVQEGNIYALSSSYFQTASPENVYNFSGKNSFIQAEEAHSNKGESYGVACTGARGFPILGINLAAGTLKLSGDISELQRGVGKSFSYAFSQSYGTSCMVLTAFDTDEGIAYFDAIRGGISSYAGLTEDECADLYWNDDNGLYCPDDPTIGNAVLYNFYGNHAEGGSAKAIGKYTHAEGRKTTADARYSHCEGTHNFAGGMGAHCEGGYNVALGQFAHCSGQHNFANGANSCAEGYKASALANNQYVWSNGTAYGESLSAKPGTFCINPTGGLSGLYIGAKSLQQHMTESGSATIKADIRAALAPCFQDVSDLEDLDVTSLAAALSALWDKVK